MSKKTIISILTAFVMAFTVFGCTGLSFAEEETAETEKADNAVQDKKIMQTEESEITENEEQISLIADPKENSIDLKWNDIEPDTEEEGASVYYVLEGEAINNQQKTEETSFEVTNLQPDTKYTFKITAWETSKEQDFEDKELCTAEITTQTIKDKLPTPFPDKPVAGMGTVTLKWFKVDPINGGTMTYDIYKSTKETAVPIKSGIKDLTVTFKGLPMKSITYRYYIKAVEKDRNGNTLEESDFEEFDPVTTKDFGQQKLTGLVADPGYKAVLLEWNRVEGATGYKIYWRTGGERGNIDTGKCSDGRTLKTFRSAKTRKYEVVKKPGHYKYLATVKNPSKGKVKFNKRGLKMMNHTYVYFYQFMIVPYYEDGNGTIYASNVKGKWNDSAVNGTSQGRCQTQYSINVIRQNTVLPMYVFEAAKASKPIYRTYSTSNTNSKGRFGKGHTFICFNKADGRVQFYGKSNSSNTGKTYWFAQKNARTIQGYYLNNGNKYNMGRKDWKTGYSKKTVLDYVNHAGLSSKSGYLVWASKYAQHVYIFKGHKGHWKLLNGGKDMNATVSKGAWSNLCSSGKVNIQSRNGKYVIFGKQYKANRKKYDYFCLSKLHKTVRLHTILFKNGAKVSSKRFHDKRLGNPVSHGCIRMRPAAAQFIYKHVPKKSRTLVY